MTYFDLSYRPKRNDLIAEFKINPNTKDVAKKIALESSTGTWTNVDKPKPVEKLDAKAFYKKGNIIKVAYNIKVFEKGSIPQLMSAIGGNIFGMKALDSLRLEDIHFPTSYQKSFRGPKYGIIGVRKKLNIKNRPLLGTIVKPKVGFTEKQHAKKAYQAWLGGCDIVKDDENLTSMGFNNFYTRVKETLKLRKKAEKKTSETKAYMPNVTAPYNEMLKRAKYVGKKGGRYMMVDIVSVGWSALQELRNEGLDLIIHAHRAGHATFTRNKNHGISMLVIAKLARLIGVDQIHIGAIVGKMTGSKSEVLQIEDEIESKDIIEKNLLAEDWTDTKPIFAVASGGLHPGRIPDVVKYMGKDIIVQLGGGIHGHPGGTRKGATAAKQALNATMGNIKLKHYAKDHKELKTALEKWG